MNVPEEYKQLYDVVFDEEDHVKPCGRQACSDLIVYLQHFTDKDLGNPYTGQMNVTTVKNVYHELFDNA